MKFIPVFQQHVGNGQWDLEQLVDRSGTLELTLVDSTGRQMSVSFESYLAYRKIDEGDALLMLSEIRKTGGTAKYFYRVENSEFLKWFNNERCASEVLDDSLIHFTIAAMNDIVDVLAFESPRIDSPG